VANFSAHDQCAGERNKLEPNLPASRFLGLPAIVLYLAGQTATKDARGESMHVVLAAEQDRSRSLGSLLWPVTSDICS
jgi:hypothetical protein